MGRQLVARTRELTELLAAATAGRGAVLSGPAGVGKTSLAAVVAERVEASGDPVERIVATEASRTISFGALAPLLTDDVSPQHPALVVQAIHRHQRERAGDRPTLLVIDDAHLLDDQSAAAVLGLVTSGSLRVVATVREGTPAPDAVHALWKDGYLPRHEITPFDRDGTRAFLTSVLGGEVGSGTASFLWQHTRGNALYLSELVRDATTNDHLVEQQGVWIWRGDLTVPPRLADLLDRRFDGLDAAGLDALAALVLGEPLALATLEAVASIEGVAELEARQIVAGGGHDPRLRFAHPMIGAAAVRHITPTRRRRIADALTAAGGGGADDVVRRAMWQLDGSGRPDVELLRDAAAAVFLTQPDLARRFVERALPHDETPLSALLLADAHAELGDVDAARAAQGVAFSKVRSDEDLLRARLNVVSLTAFSDRRPDVALDLLAEARADLPDRFGTEIDSMAAQLTVFSARPAEALALAEQVLDAAPDRASAIRATSVRVIGLAMVDRSVEAIALAGRLLADVVDGPASPYAQGIAHIAAQVARFVYWVDQAAPATDPSGRWPVPPPGGGDQARVFHPLFDGGRRLLQGRAEAAVAPLREAVVQQRSGEGLLRSEAVALLSVALAATRRTADARDLLARSAPDRVAVYPGLRPWAESAVAAAEGRPAAVDLAFAAFADARAAGSPISAVAYLASAARYGAVGPAAARLGELDGELESPITRARALGITARASGDGTALLEAAEAHAALGIIDEAAHLAALAVAALGQDRSSPRARAAVLADDLRRQLGRGDAAAPVPGSQLTRRELEIATLAATGRSDSDIAAALVISVRTVESHLAAAYRKLGIGSRRGLAAALAEQRAAASA